MAAVLAYGACPERTWPYDPRLFAQEPPAQAYTEARQYGAIQYARIDNRASALSALADGHPVVFGILLPQRCYEEAAVSGKIPPPQQSEQGVGGHAMLFVGYDQRDSTFIVRNSWGPTWGDRRYCTIPFAVVERCCPPNSLWILADPQQRTSFSVVRPAEANAPAPRPTAAASVSSLASRLRDEIRESLANELAASSERIASMVKAAAAPARPPAAGDAKDVFPLPLSPGSGSHVTRGFGDGTLADDQHHFIGVWRGQFQTPWGLSCKIENHLSTQRRVFVADPSQPTAPTRSGPGEPGDWWARATCRSITTTGSRRSGVKKRPCSTSPRTRTSSLR